MKKYSRRQFLRIGGYGMAGLALTSSGLSALMPKRANACSGAWKFGVMADTQWKLNTGAQEDSCAVAIIDALNQEFIRHDVKFVIQVGDLVDVETNSSGERTLPTRADHAQALYDAGIGFFPVRGNHESSSTAANEFTDLFPQTMGGGSNLFGARNFKSPVMPSTITDPTGERLRGLSYAFDYGNIRCVLIDQFVRKDGTNLEGYGSSYNGNAVDQVSWVDEVLQDRDENTHAFVFSHKNLIGQNHKDVLFGSSLTSNEEYRDEFIASLHDNNVAYYMSGHDHLHNHSMVSTSDSGPYPGKEVRQLICSSNSYKFYTPKSGDDGRETPLDQELYTIGFYIVTVDGPMTWVDFYSSSKGGEYGPGDLKNPPDSFTFYWRERFGCSLNGKQYVIGPDEFYTGIKDYYKGTSARILAGANCNKETDYLGRPLSKNIFTGWRPCTKDHSTASNILTLWNIVDNLSLYAGTGVLPDADETEQADIFVLSMTYDHRKVDQIDIRSGRFALATVDDETGEWVNAVEMNFGGAMSFKIGPWDSGCGLGTYGVDPKTRTVWAVINHEGDFAAVDLSDRKKGHHGRDRRRNHRHGHGR